MESTIKMGDKTLNVRIKLGTFKRIKELTGVDGIEYVKGVTSDPIAGTGNLLLAAVQTYDAYNGSVQISKDELSRLYDDADMNIIEEVITLYVQFLNPDTQGEEKEKAATPSPSRKFKN